VASGQFVEFPDGTYVVGIDIQPGTYRSRDLSSSCGWTRDVSNGLVNLTVSGSVGAGPSVVTILPTDKKFTSDNCGIWSTDLSAIVPPGSPIGDGTYIVGVDVMPGTYHAHVLKDPRGYITACFWARLSDFTGLKWIASDNEGVESTVTILATDKGFETQGCDGWVRQ
jgi:hypothetical protein